GTGLPRYRNLDVVVRNDEGQYESVKPLPRPMSLHDVEVGRGAADELSATELRALASQEPLSGVVERLGDDENGSTEDALAALGFGVTEADGSTPSTGDEDDEF